MSWLLKDRTEAGQLLANCLSPHAHQPHTLVLALPRGGVVVAFAIAQKLQLPLDICLVRKLGVPQHQELAMGAIAAGNIAIFNEALIEELRISPSAIAATIQAEKEELQRRERIYRGDRPRPPIQGQIIILVDDGMATGATLKAAIASVKREQPQSIIVAVPIASAQSCQDVEKEVNSLICLEKSDSLSCIGRWYQDFSQTTDAEVCDLLGNKIAWGGINTPAP